MKQTLYFQTQNYHTASEDIADQCVLLTFLHGWTGCVSCIEENREFIVPATVEMWKYYRATDGVLPVAQVFGGVRRGAFWDGKGGGGGERGGDGGCGGLLE